MGDVELVMKVVSRIVLALTLPMPCVLFDCEEKGENYRIGKAGPSAANRIVAVSYSYRKDGRP